ncbi:MAG: acyl-CoA synthetase [Haliea sp.]|jgi:3-oxocholest-4-en-26-oate---CoA ligase|nr:acyl-CoA synthetase [Haliea sp.]MDP5065045.1 acyl-CoA synthetase [Haliea sp.]
MARHFNIADLYELVADRVSDRVALVCGAQRSTYGELEQRANRLAHFLAAQGVGAGQHVGLYLYNCNEYLEGMLACFKLRAVPININYRYVEEELAYILDNADLVACIHHREFAPHIAAVRSAAPALKTLVYVDDSSGENVAAVQGVSYDVALEGQSSERDFAERADDDLFVLYTGGTTGMPKGVMWPHKSVFYAAMGGGGYFHPDGVISEPEQIADRIGDFAIVGIALAPLMHGACWWYACIQLLSGNTLVLNPSHHLVAAEVWDIVERERVNSLTIVGDAMAVPLLDALEAHPGRWDLSSVFAVGSGGAVFSASKQAGFQALMPNIMVRNTFGSSEAGAMGSDGGGKAGEGLGNVARSEFMSVLAADAEGHYRHVAAGEKGIFARCGHIPVGYYNDPVKTAATFVPVDNRLWLLTGDEAKLEEDDTITVYGRGSNCINTGGEKVFPEEVEQALKNHPAVFDCLIVATPDERLGSKVTAVVAVREGHSLDLPSLQAEARKHVAGYKVPRELHLVSEVPRAPSGKPAYPKALGIALSGEFRAG